MKAHISKNATKSTRKFWDKKLFIKTNKKHSKMCCEWKIDVWHRRNFFFENTKICRLSRNVFFSNQQINIGFLIQRHLGKRSRWVGRCVGLVKNGHSSQNEKSRFFCQKKLKLLMHAWYCDDVFYKKRNVHAPGQKWTVFRMF